MGRKPRGRQTGDRFRVRHDAPWTQEIRNVKSMDHICKIHGRTSDRGEGRIREPGSPAKAQRFRKAAYSSTFTPRQKATRPSIIFAMSLGSG